MRLWIIKKNCFLLKLRVKIEIKIIIAQSFKIEGSLLSERLKSQPIVEADLFDLNISLSPLKVFLYANENYSSSSLK